MKKIFEGVVMSVHMEKTAVVEVVRKKPHPLYKKLLQRGKRYKVDTREIAVVIGDRVKIAETRPLAKGKFFKVIEVKK